MKPAFSLLVSFCLGVALFAAPTRNDVIVATTAVTDSAIVNCAGFVATPQYMLPGCTLTVDKGGALPSKLSLQQSDMASYLGMIPEAKPDGNWFQKLLASASGPLDTVARTYLSVHDWKAGEAVLDGVLIPHFPSGMGLVDLIRIVASQAEMESIATDVDVWVRGRRVSVPVHVRGSFLVKNVKGEGLSIEPVNLVANGE